MDWGPIILTLKLSAVVTAILFAVSIPLAYWLAFTRWRFKVIIETLISMPLVLPPTVIGFYLLLFFSPNNLLGKWLDSVLGIRLVFSFEGLIVASVIYSLPFMVQPIHAGFKQIPVHLREVSYTLGKGRFTTLYRVLLPNMKPALLTGAVLAFAHTIGEFGVVLMIGGNIPGRTQVASIAIYDEVEALNYAAANQYSLILFALAFFILLAVYFFNDGLRFNTKV